MSYEGSDLQYKTTIPNSVPGTTPAAYEVVTEEFQIPSYFELSVAYDYAVDNQNNLALATTFRSNNSLEDHLNFGMEYSFSKILFLRGGYNLLSENQESSIFGLTLGAGLSQELGNNLDISFDYAYRDVKDFPTSNHIVTVKLGFQ